MGRGTHADRAFWLSSRSRPGPILGAMLVRYYVELPHLLASVEEALTRVPREWIPGLVRAANGRGERLMTEVGLGGPGRSVRKKVEVELSEPYRLPSKTVLPLAWRATGLSSLFPTMEADIGVAALGANRTQLSFSGQYRPPLWSVGRAIDSALLHRVAEATAKDFLDRVAEGLQEIISGRATGGASGD